MARFYDFELYKTKYFSFRKRMGEEEARGKQLFAEQIVLLDNFLRSSAYVS